MNIIAKTAISATVLFATSLAATTAQAQYEHCGGIYMAYPTPTEHSTPTPPNGYKPFYISHFARHGSRWLPADSRYEAVASVFADTTNLTELGQDVRRRINLICADAMGRGGELTALGYEQHRDMAKRMVETYPGVFTSDAVVTARASVVGRCVMSMGSFLLQLTRMRPEITVDATSSRRDIGIIAYTSDEMRTLEDTLHRVWRTDSRRLMTSLFRDTTRIGVKGDDLLSELHALASDMQNTRIGVSLYDIFTPEEIQTVYEDHNWQMQTCNGINAFNQGIPERCALTLWEDFRTRANAAIERKENGADLRFGHDTSLYRLLSLMGFFADENRMDKIIPMGANLQIVFYRGEGETLITIFHNERQIAAPGLKEKAHGGFYSWREFEEMVEQRVMKFKK